MEVDAEDSSSSSDDNLEEDVEMEAEREESHAVEETSQKEQTPAVTLKETPKSPVVPPVTSPAADEVAWAEIVGLLDDFLKLAKARAKQLDRKNFPADLRKIWAGSHKASWGVAEGSSSMRLFTVRQYNQAYLQAIDPEAMVEGFAALGYRSPEGLQSYTDPYCPPVVAQSHPALPLAVSRAQVDGILRDSTATVVDIDFCHALRLLHIPLVGMEAFVHGVYKCLRGALDAEKQIKKLGLVMVPTDETLPVKLEPAPTDEQYEKIARSMFVPDGETAVCYGPYSTLYPTSHMGTRPTWSLGDETGYYPDVPMPRTLPLHDPYEVALTHLWGISRDGANMGRTRRAVDNLQPG